MPGKPLEEQHAALITQATPDQLKVAEQAFLENTQTVVWIVGLCSAMIALLAAKDSPFTMDGGLRGGLVVTLTGAVLCGVSQRLTRQVVQEKHNRQLLQFRGQAAAFMFEYSDTVELEEFWTPADIRARMLELWPQVQVPDANIGDVEVWRQAFGVVRAGRIEYQEKRQRLFEALVGAFEGKTPDESTAAFSARTLDPNALYADIRNSARNLRHWRRASGALYGLTALLFSVALLILSLTAFAATQTSKVGVSVQQPPQVAAPSPILQTTRRN